MTEELLPFCECGECGLRVTKKGNRFILGHHRRGKSHTSESIKLMSDVKLGKPHTTPAQIAADKAHSERMHGVPHSAKQNSANSKAHTGVPLSPEHCTAISSGKLGVPNPHISPDQIAADDAKRGGYDIVWHHIIYDHSDLSKNIIPITRSMHMILHQLFRKYGIEIPHINIKRGI